MHSAHRPQPPSWLVPSLLIACALVGCSRVDPLEDIRRRQESGDFAGTLEPLQQLLRERHGDSEVHYRYGLALARTGEPGLAEWSLDEAMKDPKWLLPAGQQLAYNALSSGNTARAIEVASAVLEAHPDNVEVLLLRANARARSRLHYEDALADVERVLELDPKSPEAMEPKILSLLALERIDEAGEAIDELGRLIQETHLGTESEGWHCATTAIFADDQDDEELARERWADCLERFPGHANVVTNALKFFDERGESDRSLEILEAALAAEPTSRSYRIRLANRLRLAARPEESEKLLREGTDSAEPQVAALAWFDLAKHFQDMGDHQKSSEAQERAVSVSREAGLIHPQLMLEYADSLLLAGEYDRALAIAAEMTLDAHAAMIRARVAQEQGRPEEALVHFQDAFRLWPDNPFARYHAALACEAVGDFDGAVEAYRYAIRIAPDATDARNRLAQLHLAEGRRDEALALLRLQAERLPLDLEGELLSLRLWGLLGQHRNVVNQVERIRHGSPDLVGKALASAAEGVHQRAGAVAALRLLRGASGADLTAPHNADALRAIVRYSFEAKRGDEALPAVQAALAAHPDATVFHEIHGLCLELAGSAERARSAYRTAIELDPQNARALAGLARLTGDSGEALALLDRASAADPGDPDPARRAADLLIAAGRDVEANERLEALLRAHPFDHAASSLLAERLLAQGDASDHALERARRAGRFGGGAEAFELLARVHRARGEEDLAAQAEGRAKSLRERAHAQVDGTP